MIETVKKYYIHILRSVFDIREGEYRRTVLMQINIFLIISTLLIVKPAVNGLFLSSQGAKSLPYVYGLVAIFAGLVSLFYSRLISRKSLNIIITRTMFLSVSILIVFGVLLRLNFLEAWVLYLFFIWVAIFAVLSASQFWILANIIFNPREAKRLFGFIGAGAIAGGIFGGYLTSIITEYIGSENLPFIAAFLLVFCIPITQTIWKRDVLPNQTKFQRKKRVMGFDANPLALIRKSKYLTYLAVIIGISVIVAKLVDYQFSAIASVKIPEPDELTSFFGFWFSTFNLISLGIQLFFTRRVVGVFGVGTSLFILPLGIMLGSMLVLVFPELWAVIFLKLLDGSLKQSVNKSAVELMSLPIPVDIKNQTKSFIDVFVDSAATGISGLILLFLVTGLDLSTRYISLMILALLFLWIYFAWKIRGEYVRSFKLKVDQRKDIHDKKGTMDFSDESVLSGLQKVLREGTEEQMVYVLRKIREMPNVRMFDSVSSLVHHTSPRIRAEALACLYFFRSQRIVDKVLPLVNDPDQQVKTAAFEYIFAHSPEKRTEILEKYLKDKDYRVRGAALVSLSMETRNNPDLQKRFDLETRILKKIKSIDGLKNPEEVRFRKLILLKVIGQSRQEMFYPFIIEHLHDKDPDLVKQALLSAGDTMCQDYIPRIATYLTQSNYRDTAKAALLNYGPGIIDNFTDIVHHEGLDREILKYIPSIVEKIPTQPSVEFLFLLVDQNDISLKMEALRSLNNLKLNHPHLGFHNKLVFTRILNEAHLYLETLSVLYSQITTIDSKKNVLDKGKLEKERDARKSLIELLERRLDGNLERIFRLLGLKYPLDDIFNIYQGLQSKKRDMRLNAVEFLDNLLETNLKRLLVPIVEMVLLDELSEDTIKVLNLKIPSEVECLSLLLAGHDMRVKRAVLYLISTIPEKQYISLVEGCLANEDSKLSAFANEILIKIRKN